MKSRVNEWVLYRVKRVEPSFTIKDTGFRGSKSIESSDLKHKFYNAFILNVPVIQKNQSSQAKGVITTFRFLVCKAHCETSITVTFQSLQWVFHTKVSVLHSA